MREKHLLCTDCDKVFAANRQLVGENPFSSGREVGE